MAKGFNSRGMGGFGGGINLFIGGVWLCITDILFDSSLKEPRIL